MKRSFLRSLITLSVMALGGVLVSAPALAQDFPTKQPIKIVVPYPPGGSTDVLARITGEYLQRRLNQTVIVDNRIGATGSIGANSVAKAPADGYTLMFIPGGDVTAAPAVRTNLPYKYDDFTFLVQAFVATPVLIANPKLPINTFQELAAYMKANPGKLSVGTPGIGHIVHLSSLLLGGAVGSTTLTVPFPGSAPIYTAMMGGNVDVTMATPPFLDGLKVIGSVGTQRSPNYPDKPTLEEAGIKGATWDLWFGFVAPPNLPKPIADRLTSELVAIMKDPEAVARFKAAMSAPPAQLLTGDAFKKRVTEEYNSWRGVVVREKITVE